MIVVTTDPSLPSKCTYIIDRAAELQLIDVLCSSYENRNINNNEHHRAVEPDISNWSGLEIKSFFTMTVKGFLNADLYTTMTEFMSRAEGSFGVQVENIFTSFVLFIFIIFLLCYFVIFKNYIFNQHTQITFLV